MVADNSVTSNVIFKRYVDDNNDVEINYESNADNCDGITDEVCLFN
jgi:hypothetical protein